jgi:hypothetical protein
MTDGGIDRWGIESEEKNGNGKDLSFKIIIEI